MDRDLGGLVVADFADHDDVGVLPHDAAQAVCEREADVGPHLDLADAADLVLHGVLDGEDVGGRRPDLLKRGVEAGGFSRAGGSRGQDDAVRDVDELAELGERVGQHAQLLKAHHRGALVEDAHDGALAEHGGNDRHADVDLTPGDGELDAAVLGKSALGDVHLAEDFHAGHEGRVHAFGRVHHVVQHAVDTVADLDVALVGFEVDVARAVADRLGEQQVHHLDDRGLAGHFLEVREVGGVVDLGHRPFVGGQGGQDVFEEPLLDALADQRGVRKDRAHGQAEKDAEIVHGAEARDAADGDHERGPVEPDRQHLVFEGELTGGEVHGLRIGPLLG